MTNAEFFAKTARGQGRKVSGADINPVTGKVRTAFDDLGSEEASQAARRSRSSNGGMTVARPGVPSQRKILGVDRQQAAEQAYKEDHKNDQWFKAARAARQADPNAGHETPEQFAANNEAETPLGGLAARPRPDDFAQQVRNAKPMPKIDNSHFDEPQKVVPTGVRRIEGANGAPPTFVADKTGTDSLADTAPRVPPGDFAKQVANAAPFPKVDNSEFDRANPPPAIAAPAPTPQPAPAPLERKPSYAELSAATQANIDKTKRNLAPPDDPQPLAMLKKKPGDDEDDQKPANDDEEDDQ